MRILFFSHYFPPERNVPASRTHEHCKRWVAAGHDVIVVTCAPHHPSGAIYHGYRNRLRRLEEMDGIRVVRCLTFLSANEGKWRRGLSYLFYLVAASCCALMERRPDIVIATSPQLFCGLAGVVTSKVLGRPLVLEIRDLWPESVLAVGAMNDGIVVRMLESLEKRMYRAARHIVTVGEGYRQRLIRQSVSPERLSVVMNGVDRELFYPRARDERISGSLGIAGRFVVSYCGTIGMAHGLDVVIRAAAVLRSLGRTEIVFLLVGEGAALERLRREAARARLDNVVFAGALDRTMIPAVLSISDGCLIHLRKSSTFSSVMPSKVFEAAAMARPIILGVRGFAQDFVMEAGCGLCVEPEDEKELVEAVLRLASDSELRYRLGVAGREFVTERFDRGRLASQYLKIFERVLAG